jgi:hypothetical protein
MKQTRNASSHHPARRHAAALVGLAVTTALAGFIACGPNQDNLPPPPPPPPPPPSSLTQTPPPDMGLASADSGAAATPKAEEKPVTLVSGPKGEEPAKPTPIVKIAAPSKDQVVAADKAAEFAVKLDVKNWATAAGSSHVHLILDNRPYKRIDDPKLPVTLNELTGGEAIAEGQHVLVAFASRGSHESVKTKDAIFVTQFFVGKKGETPQDLKKPLLVYSRPKGEYKGATANHIIVDFQLWNAELGDKKNKVNVTVTGPGIDSPLTQKVTEFGAPLFIENARNGSYSVKLELIGADDKTVAGPWNTTTRSISVDRDAISDMASMGHGGMDMGDAGAPPPADAGAKKAPKK